MEEGNNCQQLMEHPKCYDAASGRPSKHGSNSCQRTQLHPKLQQISVLVCGLDPLRDAQQAVQQMSAATSIWTGQHQWHVGASDQAWGSPSASNLGPLTLSPGSAASTDSHPSWLCDRLDRQHRLASEPNFQQAYAVASNSSTSAWPFKVHIAKETP